MASFSMFSMLRTSTRSPAESMRNSLKLCGVDLTRFDKVPAPTIRMVGAGTLSKRVRSTPQSFNELRIDSAGLRVEVRNMENIENDAMRILDVPEDATPPRRPGEPVAPAGRVPRTDPPVH